MKVHLDFDPTFDAGKMSTGAEAAGKKALKEPAYKKHKPKKKKVHVTKKQKRNLSLYAQKLPVGRTQQQARKRKKMFEGFDQSGNGYLSLAEIELGVLNFLGEDIFVMKPAIKMAYKVSRGVGK